MFGWSLGKRRMSFSRNAIRCFACRSLLPSGLKVLARSFQVGSALGLWLLAVLTGFVFGASFPGFDGRPYRRPIPTPSKNVNPHAAAITIFNFRVFPDRRWFSVFESGGIIAGLFAGAGAPTGGAGLLSSGAGSQASGAGEESSVRGGAVEGTRIAGGANISGD